MYLGEPRDAGQLDGAQASRLLLLQRRREEGQQRARGRRRRSSSSKEETGRAASDAPDAPAAAGAAASLRRGRLLGLLALHGVNLGQRVEAGKAALEAVDAALIGHHTRGHALEEGVVARPNVHCGRRSRGGGGTGHWSAPILLLLLLPAAPLRGSSAATQHFSLLSVHRRRQRSSASRCAAHAGLPPGALGPRHTLAPPAHTGAHPCSRAWCRWW